MVAALNAHFMYFWSFLNSSFQQHGIRKDWKKSELRKKNQTASLWIILRIHKVWAHTWHSAFLRNQLCCLPSTSGTAYQERHFQCYFCASQLVHLSEVWIELLASPCTQVLVWKSLVVFGIWKPGGRISRLTYFQVYCPSGCHSRYSVQGAQVLSTYF